MQDSNEPIETDVVVVGGGGSGLAAAIAAAEAGATVTLIEKNAELGGTTGLSVGSITTSGTPHQEKAGIRDSADAHFEDIALFAGDLVGKDNLALRRVMVEHVPETFRWLMAMGLTFVGPMPEPPHRTARMHNVVPNSRAYTYVLSAKCRELGVHLNTSHRALQFLRAGSRVAGVSGVRADGSAFDILARRGVVLASGDYAASSEIKARHAPRHAPIEAINPASEGDGQLMCERLGCRIVNPELIFGPQLRFAPPPAEGWAHRLPLNGAVTAIMAHGMRWMPEILKRPIILSFVATFLAPEAMMFREGAILVNREGKRFCDERDAPAFQVPSQTRKEAFILFDAAFAEKFSAWPHIVSTAPGVAYAYVPDYRRSRRDLYNEASTLAGLAEKIGVPPPALEAAVQDYNAQGGRPPVLSAPFAALGPVKSWTVLTDGGVSVSPDHHVLDAQDTPIPGLFAAGSSGQGGLLLEGHGHHLAWAFTSGRRAGANAARGPVNDIDVSSIERI